MVKSLADLRVEKSTVRPQQPYRAVVGEGKKYAVESRQLVAEHDDLMVEKLDLENAESQKPRKTGAKSSPRLREIGERIAAILERLVELGGLMGEYEGDVTVSAEKSDGEWEQWRIANPAREEGQPGYLDDLAIARGYCNSSALIDDLAAYVVAWNGEPLAPGDFDALNLSRPDKKEIAAIVVGLYETGDDLPKLRSGLSALRASGTSSGSPAPSA